MGEDIVGHFEAQCLYHRIFKVVVYRLTVGVLVVVRVQGMQRPLVRRRHTLFPNHDLSQLRDDNFDEEVTVKADLVTRPGLNRKTQSFYRPAVIANHTLQHAVHIDVMADDTLTSPTPPITGKSLQPEFLPSLR